MGGSVASVAGRRVRASVGRWTTAALLPCPRRTLMLTAIGWLGLGGVGSVLAQEASGRLPPAPDATVRELSLTEALLLARSNNPLYLQAADAATSAAWSVREAYGQLLPSVTASGTLAYSGHGQQLIGNFTGDDLGAGSTDYLISNYSLGVSQSYGPSTYYGLSRSRAERSAAGAWLSAEGYELESRVTVRYLAALRAEEARIVAERQLAQAEENLELAEARFGAGAVPGTDLRQAEVERGRAAVALVRAGNAARAEEARLLGEIGVVAAGPLELVTRFEVFRPSLGLDGLLGPAAERHPRLTALRESERARDAALDEARGSYLPTLTVSARWSGFTREIRNTDYLIASARSSADSRARSCEFNNRIAAGLSSELPGYPQECGRFAVTPGQEARILDENRVFPFGFERQPVSLAATVSLPVFQGLARQRRIEEARAAARTSTHARRAEELRVRTEVTAAHGNLLAAYEVVQIETGNVELATRQLDLAQERYGLGAALFLELLEAQSSAAVAELDLLNAVYDFHGAWVELRRAAGIDLAPPGGAG
ncbi:MAG: TolC family protein [Gammaproteobacteria bacterium]|nr:TolC family protein [Gammaproteobacteria bacterium]MDE0248359.1 TolC family protein [Gammaproteobacteria bacterium]